MHSFRFFIGNNESDKSIRDFIQFGENELKRELPEAFIFIHSFITPYSGDVAGRIYCIKAFA